MTVLLLNRGRISAKELADRFEVSTKTIYRDMDTLSQSGIPVFAHQGTTGGFEIMEQYTISRQYLTLGEISSIIAAVKGMGTALDDATFSSLLEKVEVLLNRSEKDGVSHRGESLVFDLNPWAQGPVARHKVNLFKEAIEASRRVQLSYINRNGTETERETEPYALILKGNVWYLHAYCLLREQFRVFRLSRVQQFHSLPGTFERRQTPVLDSYAWDQEWLGTDETEVTLVFRAQVRYRVGDAFPADQVTVLEDGTLRVKRMFTLDEWFYGMLLSYGDQVMVEQPDYIAEEVIQRAKNIIGRYQN
ncbi:YafY family protein [Paenibacillus sp. FSL H8-0548]|uniref:helix-turn-helix transcriptional regulator n=1 Tax=Paenibacillus sp. FSL H8-0548 TaxID=1920422 RepID=UPI0026D89F42|nr:YafY family protein [Paenibacillus sp. FSL H8-0548]